MTTDSREMNRRLIRILQDRTAGFWALDNEALPEPKRVFRTIWETRVPGLQWGLPPVLLEYERVDCPRHLGRRGNRRDSNCSHCE